MNLRLHSRQKVREVLDRKGRRVFMVSSQSTVCAAVRLMLEERVGSVLVAESTGPPIGMLSDRDVMTRVVATTLSPTSTRVVDVMSDMVTISPEADLLEAMRLMTERRVRHLPVFGPTGLEGLVSIGDVTKAITEAQQSEIEQLESYISGPSLSI